VGGNPEVVVPGETGYLTPPGDAGAMARAILALLDNPQLRRRLGQQGRERAHTVFGLEAMVLAVRATYDILLDGRPTAPAGAGAPRVAALTP